MSYDLDGNLTGDRRWVYAWDAENRLADMFTQSGAESVGVPGTRQAFAYDAWSRRIRKTVEKRVSSSDPWVLQSDTRFVYDGWNMVGEAEYHTIAADAPLVYATGGAAQPYWRRTCVWGQDLSGTLQGAGGVGGLLMLTRHERGSKPRRTCWATWDLNGNVTGLVENNLKAVYDYDPFGKALRVSEPEEDMNPFRFSTKYTDSETRLVYYGYRYYNSILGRWISPDPIEERGGANLYGVVENDLVNECDYLGHMNIRGSKLGPDKCEILLYIGHKSVAPVWAPKHADSAGGYEACNPVSLNSTIPEEQRVPRLPVHSFVMTQFDPEYINGPLYQAQIESLDIKKRVLMSIEGLSSEEAELFANEACMNAYMGSYKKAREMFKSGCCAEVKIDTMLGDTKLPRFS